jgi:sugar phosphate isomerase/epimerase
MRYTRRDFGKLALAALPAARLLSARQLDAAGLRQTRPNSKFGGVHIGINAPYSFRGMPGGPDDILDYCRKLGVSALELRSQPVETFLGVPAHLVGGGRGGRRGPTAPPAEQAAQNTPQQARAAELLKWRLSVPMSRVREFRTKYEDAGVLIEIVKFDGIYGLTDDGLDYSFNLAKALGARAISCEIAADGTKRLGQFADKHQLMVGYHGHASTTPAHWETAFSQAKYNGANVDLGHFVAGNNVSPVEFIKKHHARITHLHVKDRKLNNGPNTPFGQGDTPIKEVLQLIKASKWHIQGTIEYEYPLPAGSDVMTELAKCVQYCKEALES